MTIIDSIKAGSSKRRQPEAAAERDVQVAAIGAYLASPAVRSTYVALERRRRELEAAEAAVLAHLANLQARNGDAS